MVVPLVLRLSVSMKTLHRAAREGDLDELREGIARGDDVNGRDGEDDWGNMPPLMWACLMGRHECARALIEAGAAVDVVSYGATALMMVCISGSHECAQALSDAGAAVDEVGIGGRTALAIACEVGHHECAHALIDACAAVDMVDNNGNTSLMKACVIGRHECIRALIDAQADLELTNRHGKNALMIACESLPPYSYYPQSMRQGGVRCALSLLEATAPIQVADFPDWAAALQFACGRLQLMEVVLASHVIEDAPQLANVRDLQTDAQGVIVNFAGDMLALAKLPKRPHKNLNNCVTKTYTSTDHDDPFPTLPTVFTAAMSAA